MLYIFLVLVWLFSLVVLKAQTAKWSLASRIIVGFVVVVFLLALSGVAIGEHWFS